MAKRARPQAKFGCKDCRTKLHVVSTTRVGNGAFIALRRRRECPKCGKRSTYYELPDWAGPRAVAARFPRVAKTLELMGKLTAAVRGLADEED